MEPLTPDQSRLADQYLPVALKIAREWGGDRHDNRSDAGWATIEAAAAWQGQMPFPRFLRSVVTHQLIDRYRAERQQRRKAAGECVPLHSVPGRSHDGFAVVDACQAIESLKLDDAEDALLALVIEGAICQEIADQTGCTLRQAYRSRDELRRRLKRVL